MEEVLREALNVTTKDQLRALVTSLSPEQQLRLLACALDVAHAARVLHREYAADNHGNPAFPFDHRGINWSEWPQTKEKWEDLAFALTQVFGLEKAKDRGPRPPWLDVDWGESILARCNVSRTIPATAERSACPPLPPNATDGMARQWRDLVATFVANSLHNAGQRFQRLRIPDGSLDVVLIMFDYPLMWKTFLTPGCTTGEQLVAELLKQLKPQETTNVPLEQLPQGKAPQPEA